MPMSGKRFLHAGFSFAFLWVNLLLAQAPTEEYSDPALPHVESVLAKGNYLVFHQDTVLASENGPLSTDILFIDCNGVLDRPLEGSLIILNGELSLRSKAEVTGDVILLRGTLFQSRDAKVKGEVMRTSSAECINRVRDQLQDSGFKKSLPIHLKFRTNRMGGFRLEGYDRVDGFSISWGFTVEQPDMGDFPVFQGKFITATTYQAVGFNALLKVPLDLKARYSLGIGARSITDTNDRWRLGDLENAFKAFVSGNDHRYYFRREGYSIELRREMWNRSYLSLAYQDERYYSLKNQSPFTLFGPENFHSNLPVESGRVRSLVFDGMLDTRKDPFFALSGFWGRLQGELAGGTLGGRHSFARIDLELKRWDTFYDIHHTFFWFKWAYADRPLPFQRGYTLGNTLRGYDNFAFSGDRMLMAQALYGLNLPSVSVVEYLFFRWRAEVIYETGIAFYQQEPDSGYSNLKKDVGVGFSGDTIIGRIGVHLFQNLDVSFRSGRNVAVTLNMNIFD